MSDAQYLLNKKKEKKKRLFSGWNKNNRWDCQVWPTPKVGLQVKMWLLLPLLAPLRLPSYNNDEALDDALHPSLSGRFSMYPQVVVVYCQWRRSLKGKRLVFSYLFSSFIWHWHTPLSLSQSSHIAKSLPCTLKNVGEGCDNHSYIPILFSPFSHGASISFRLPFDERHPTSLFYFILFFG